MNFLQTSRLTAMGVVLACTVALTACGGGSDDGADTPVPAAQSIEFGPAPALVLGASATVSATASSGLAVRLSTSTPGICSVAADAGVVTALTLGELRGRRSPGGQRVLGCRHVRHPDLACAASFADLVVRPGSATGPARYGDSCRHGQFRFGGAVRVDHSQRSARLTASPALVTDLTAGDCVIAAAQEGNASYAPATSVTQTLAVMADRSQTLTFGCRTALGLATAPPPSLPPPVPAWRRAIPRRHRRSAPSTLSPAW